MLRIQTGPVGTRYRQVHERLHDRDQRIDLGYSTLKPFAHLPVHRCVVIEVVDTEERALEHANRQIGRARTVGERAAASTGAAAIVCQHQ